MGLMFLVKVAQYPLSHSCVFVRACSCVGIQKIIPGREAGFLDFSLYRTSNESPQEMRPWKNADSRLQRLSQLKVAPFLWAIFVFVQSCVMYLYSGFYGAQFTFTCPIPRTPLFTCFRRDSLFQQADGWNTEVDRNFPFFYFAYSFYQFQTTFSLFTGGRDLCFLCNLCRVLQ